MNKKIQRDVILQSSMATQFLQASLVHHAILRKSAGVPILSTNLV
jgi:hypothetical protein